MVEDGFVTINLDEPCDLCNLATGEPLQSCDQCGQPPSGFRSLGFRKTPESLHLGQLGHRTCFRKAHDFKKSTPPRQKLQDEKNSTSSPDIPVTVSGDTSSTPVLQTFTDIMTRSVNSLFSKGTVSPNVMSDSFSSEHQSIVKSPPEVPTPSTSMKNKRVSRDYSDSTMKGHAVITKRRAVIQKSQTRILENNQCVTNTCEISSSCESEDNVDDMSVPSYGKGAQVEAPLLGSVKRLEKNIHRRQRHKVNSPEGTSGSSESDSIELCVGNMKSFQSHKRSKSSPVVRLTKENLEAMQKLTATHSIEKPGMKGQRLTGGMPDIVRCSNITSESSSSPDSKASNDEVGKPKSARSIAEENNVTDTSDISPEFIVEQNMIFVDDATPDSDSPMSNGARVTLDASSVVRQINNISRDSPRNVSNTLRNRPNVTLTQSDRLCSDSPLGAQTSAQRCQILPPNTALNCMLPVCGAVDTTPDNIDTNTCNARVRPSSNIYEQVSTCKENEDDVEIFSYNSRSRKKWLRSQPRCKSESYLHSPLVANGLTSRRRQSYQLRTRSEYNTIYEKHSDYRYGRDRHCLSWDDDTNGSISYDMMEDKPGPKDTHIISSDSDSGSNTNGPLSIYWQRTPDMDNEPAASNGESKETPESVFDAYILNTSDQSSMNTIDSNICSLVSDDRSQRIETDSACEQVTEGETEWQPPCGTVLADSVSHAITLEETMLACKSFLNRHLLDTSSLTHSNLKGSPKHGSEADGGLGLHAEYGRVPTGDAPGCVGARLSAKPPGGSGSNAEFSSGPAARLHWCSPLLTGVPTGSCEEGHQTHWQPTAETATSTERDVPRATSGSSSGCRGDMEVDSTGNGFNKESLSNGGGKISPDKLRPHVSRRRPLSMYASRHVAYPLWDSVADQYARSKVTLLSRTWYECSQDFLMNRPSRCYQDFDHNVTANLRTNCHNLHKVNKPGDTIWTQDYKGGLSSEQLSSKSHTEISTLANDVNCNQSETNTKMNGTSTRTRKPLSSMTKSERPKSMGDISLLQMKWDYLAGSSEEVGSCELVSDKFASNYSISYLDRNISESIVIHSGELFPAYQPEKCMEIENAGDCKGQTSTDNISGSESPCVGTEGGKSNKESEANVNKSTQYNVDITQHTLGPIQQGCDETKKEAAKDSVTIETTASGLVLTPALMYTRDKLHHRCKEDIMVLVEHFYRQIQKVSEELVELLQVRHDLYEQVEMRQIAIEQLIRSRQLEAPPGVEFPTLQVPVVVPDSKEGQSSR